MADLTEEEKIVIGVCSAIAGLILIGILVFVCCVLYRRRNYGDRYRKDRYYSKSRNVDWANNDRFYGNGEVREIRKYPPPMETVVMPAPHPLPPPPLPLPPPPPPAPRTRWDMYGGRAEYRETQRPPLYIAADTTYGGVYNRDVRPVDNPPVVIPISDPEYIVSERGPEPDTIYLKYHDDQALLYTQQYREPVEAHAMRRTHSMTDVREVSRREVGRPRSKFVGEWGHTIFQPREMAYNEQAARRGKDPFLWSN